MTPNLTVFRKHLLVMFIALSVLYPAKSQAQTCFESLAPTSEEMYPDWLAPYREKTLKAFRESIQTLGSKPLEIPTPLKNDNVPEQVRSMGILAFQKLQDKEGYTRFLLGVRKQTYIALAHEGLLKENALTYSEAMLSDQVEFFEQKVMRTFRQILEERAAQFGFKIVALKDEFFGEFKSGHLIWDDGHFGMSQHGAETHPLQVIYVSRFIENKFGPGSALTFYKYMGSGQPMATYIWDEVFDADTGPGSVANSFSEPEKTAPKLRIILPMVGQ